MQFQHRVLQLRLVSAMNVDVLGRMVGEVDRDGKCTVLQINSMNLINLLPSQELSLSWPPA